MIGNDLERRSGTMAHVPTLRPPCFPQVLLLGSDSPVR